MRVCGRAQRLAHLQFVCVEEGRRGQGLGAALLRWADQCSRDECGAWQVELEVDRTNERAQALYTRHGRAVQVGSIKPRVESAYRFGV